MNQIKSGGSSGNGDIMVDTTKDIIMTMDTNIARAILSEAAAGDYFSGILPENEKDLIELANYYVEEAKLAVEEGMKDEHILAIINLAEQASPPVLSEPAVHNNDGGPPGEIKWYPGFEGDQTEEEELKIRETYPRRSSGGYSESDLREDLIPESNAAAREGLPVPKNVSESNPYDMPTDLTEIGDKSLRRLYSAFNAYSGRARWMLAIAQSNLANANHLKDAAYRTALINSARLAQLSEEKITKDIIEARAKEDEDYKDWEEKVLKHEREVIHWRALSDIYSKNVEILSREWTMRTEQYERER